MLVRSASKLTGEVVLPGDKSISHRSAMISSLSIGVTEIANYATSADCASTLKCLEDLGVNVVRIGSTVLVTGKGLSGLSAPAKKLDCGNSGTTMRLMTGILSGQAFGSELIGDASLSRRPMKRVIEPIEAMGATIRSTDGHAPLQITGSPSLVAAEHTLQIASAQIKSCILLAGLNANGITIVHEPVPTRDHTERMLRWFGADIRAEGGTIALAGGQTLRARNISVPCDISAAAFFLVAAASLAGSHLAIRNVGLNPTRTGILEVLKKLGVSVIVENERLESNEPVGDLTVHGRSGPLGSDSNVVSGKIVANLIDEIPILAVLGTQLEAGIEIRDAGELRVKESDRIKSVVENLRRLGAKIDEFPDGFRVYRSELKGAVVNSYDDHRIAMAFAVAGLLAKGETMIDGAECVDVSFPGFFENLLAAISSE